MVRDVEAKPEVVGRVENDVVRGDRLVWDWVGRYMAVKKLHDSAVDGAVVATDAVNDEAE